jgi:hypothetical protein
MQLDYLDFDFSGEAEGGGSFDAMAAVTPAQWPALQAEVLQVLDWAYRQFGAPAALEDGGDWDYALDGVREVATPLAVRYTRGAPDLDLQPGEPGAPRLVLTLTLAGSEPFCEAFRQAFPAS